MVIHQVEWADISVVSYADAGPIVTCRPARRPLPDSNQHEMRTFRCDFVLMRSVSRGTWGQDDTNKVRGAHFFLSLSCSHCSVVKMNERMSARARYS